MRPRFLESQVFLLKCPYTDFLGLTLSSSIEVAARKAPKTNREGLNYLVSGQELEAFSQTEVLVKTIDPFLSLSPQSLKADAISI